MDKKEIARRLIALRNGRPRAEVAHAVGVSVSAMGMYENASRIPQDEVKIRLARYYGVTVQELFYGDEKARRMAGGEEGHERQAR